MSRPKHVVVTSPKQTAIASQLFCVPLCVDEWGTVTRFHLSGLSAIWRQ